jgi:ATP-dependent Lhr-like helicase
MHAPWAGHLGTRAAAQVAAEIEASATTLVFTNTRSQAERWYQALLETRPDWAGVIGLHHASLSIESRRWVERGLQSGALKAAVCTSSLDLGVDFAPVDRVIQIGSPKGVARLLQRAGRSGHRPGSPSRITCVPTHALESLEAAAARAAVDDGAIESRMPVDKPFDVLIQHAITLGCGDGFARDALFAEVRSTHAFTTLTDAEWNWVLAFAGGGGVLDAYPEYRRLVCGDDGIYRVTDPRLARRHRVQIGTIVSDAAVNIQYLRGDRLGSVEESFIARLKPGDAFVIGGKAVSFVRMHDMTAWVRRAKPKTAITPRWLGGRMSLSNALARHLQFELQHAALGHADARETKALAPLFDLQQRYSRVPLADEVLAEVHRLRDGFHLCVFPFAGRHANAALAALVAWRLARDGGQSFSMAFNDYGFELLAPRDVAIDAARLRAALDPVDAAADIAASVNAAELARRHFREIARVAGLVFQGYPGEGRSARQLQATSGLFYDVYVEHDPGNPLLVQARREVLERELELTRVDATLAAIAKRMLVLLEPPRMTPLALPLVAEQMRNALSTEQVADRVARMQLAMQKPERRLRAAA